MFGFGDKKERRRRAITEVRKVGRGACNSFASASFLGEVMPYATPTKEGDVRYDPGTEANDSSAAATSPPATTLIYATPSRPFRTAHDLASRQAHEEPKAARDPETEHGPAHPSKTRPKHEPTPQDGWTATPIVVF